MTMKERSIRCNATDVRAILEGRKTQTRRVIKPQPPEWIDELHGRQLSKRAPYELENDDNQIIGWGFQDEYETYWRVPYGKPGDRLWVRESFSSWHHGCQWYDCTREGRSKVSCSNLFYRATHHFPDDDQKWVPSIHMPRWASRITLEITGVRVERLQDIDEADAAAEGLGFDTNLMGPWEGHATARDAFRALWESNNGPDSWAANPWVWAVKFDRV